MLARIFRTIWAIYGVVIFFLMLILSLPFFIMMFAFFPQKVDVWGLTYAHKIFAKVFCILTLIRVKEYNRDMLEPNENYIVVGNHQSSMDFVFHALATNRIYKWLAKKEIDNIPVMGFIVRRFVIFVARKDVTSRKASMQALNEAVEKGFSIFIYPEGTRNVTKKALKKFHTGAFRIAIETQKSIAIQTIANARQISNHRRLLDLRPGIIHLYWDKPISTKGLTLEDLPRLSEKVRATMMKYLKEEKKRFNLE